LNVTTTSITLELALAFTYAISFYSSLDHDFIYYIENNNNDIDNPFSFCYIFLSLW
jgi:hypothetical protein